MILAYKPGTLIMCRVVETGPWYTVVEYVDDKTYHTVVHNSSLRKLFNDVASAERWIRGEE